jgi:hypothetical protein
MVMVSVRQQIPNIKAGTASIPQWQNIRVTVIHRHRMWQTDS